MAYKITWNHGDLFVNNSNTTFPTSTSTGYIQLPYGVASGKNGWSFEGWTDTNNYSDDYYLGDTITISSDTTFCAVYSKSIRITFDKNGADSVGKSYIDFTVYARGDTSNVTTYYGSDYAMGPYFTFPSIRRSGNSWIYGWNTSANATSSSYSVNSTVTYHSISDIYDRTFYAITRKNVVASFWYDWNGEVTTVSGDLYNKGTASIQSITGTRSGWTFEGWNGSRNSDEAAISNGDNVHISEDTNFYSVTSFYATAYFESNGASISTTSISGKVYNNANNSFYGSFPSISRSGWNIIGWATSASAQTAGWAVGQAAYFTNGQRFYAITSKTFTFKYNINGADSISRTQDTFTIYNMETSKAMTMPTITRSGWNILGWGTSASATSAVVGSGASNMADGTNGGTENLYAITSRTLKANYSGNGATLSKSSDSATVYNTDTSTSWKVTLPTITRSGWNIRGFNTSASATSSTSGWGSGSQVTVANGATYYAITDRTLSCSYNGNGASLSRTSDSKTFYNTDTATSWSVTLPTITRSGWNIIGFNTSASATSSTSGWTSGATSKTVSSGATYYAVTSRTLTCNFNGNGCILSATSSTSPVFYNTNTATTWVATLPTITRTGWTIAGYSTNKDATSVTSGWTAGTTVTVSSGFTYYAISYRTLKALFNANGATSVGSTELSNTFYNTNTATEWTATLPTITKAGWTVVGWGKANTDSTATLGAVGSSTTIAGGTTYYAITKKQLSLKYLLENGSSTNYVDSKTIYNTDTSAIFNLRDAAGLGWQKDKYNFDGWLDADTNSRITESTIALTSNKTLYGKWMKLSSIILALKRGATLQNCEEAYVKIGGKWRTISKSFTKHDNVWKQHKQ